MVNEIFEHTKEHMDKSIEALKRDFASLRTGKVTTSIVDNIKVDYYGTPTPLNQVGSVIATDATTIAITPWEKNLLGDIEKAIQEANIGVNPNNDGDFIKLFFPANNKIKKLEKDKEISEDESKKAQDEIQKITDDHVAKVDELFKSKEADILKV